MFLLDTDVVSELRKAKSGRADRNVVAWARSVSATSLYLSAIVTLLALVAAWIGYSGFQARERELREVE